MKLNRKIKRLLRNTAWCLLGVTMLVVLVASMKANNSMLCKKVIVEIKSGREHLFLNTNDIRRYVNAVEIENKKKVEEIDIKNLEMRLEKIAWIDNVEMYFDGQNNLNIEVYERQPLCRLFKDNGSSFYIDEKMNILPLHNFFAANVPVFTGLTGDEINKQDSLAMLSIVKLAKFIKGNSFWMSQIQQVVIDEHQEFEAVPTIGKHNIIIGDTSELEAKFSKLMIFYNKVLAKVGFDKYRTINIQFKNQVVVSDSLAKSIDTATASNSIMHLIDNANDEDTVRTTQRDTTTRSNVVGATRQTVQPRRPIAPVSTARPAQTPRATIPTQNRNRNISNRNNPTTPTRTAPAGNQSSNRTRAGQ